MIRLKPLSSITCICSSHKRFLKISNEHLKTVAELKRQSIAPQVSTTTYSNFGPSQPIDYVQNNLELKTYNLDFNKEKHSFPNILSKEYFEPFQQELEEEVTNTKEVLEIPKPEKPKYRKQLTQNQKQNLCKITPESLGISSKEFKKNSYLFSWIDTSFFVNEDDRLEKTFHVLKKRMENITPLPETKTLNIFLEIAFENEYINSEELSKFIRRMQKRGLCDSNTYFLLFLDSIRKKHVIRNKKHLNKLFQEMKADDITFEKMFRELNYTKEQIEDGLKAIRRLRHNQDFKLPEYNSNKYEIPLLNNLNNFDPNNPIPSPIENLFTLEELKNLSHQQLEIEQKGVQSIQSIEKIEITKSSRKASKKIQKLEEKWSNQLSEAYEAKIQEITASQDFGSFLDLIPYLKVLEKEDYKNLMLEEVRSLGEMSLNHQVPYSFLCSKLGMKIQEKYRTKRNSERKLIQKTFDIYQHYCEYYTNKELLNKYTPREYWEMLETKLYLSTGLKMNDNSWSYAVMNRVGKIFYDMISELTLENKKGEQQKLFTFVRRLHYGSVNFYKDLQISSDVVKLYEKVKSPTIDFQVEYLPMLCPPTPWKCPEFGGFLTKSSIFVRYHSKASGYNSMINNSPTKDFQPSFDALNILGLCPWKINKPMLEIVIKIFQNHGDDSIGIPPHPSTHSIENRYSHLSEKAKKYKLNQEKKDLYSDWCNALYKLSIANHYKDNVFWFPHNFDFRGRVYPTPPHLSHIGCDMSRSVLLFAKGKPLGPKGLDWLKIHIINLTGLKSRESLETRLNYANEVMPEILDSADHPLDGRQWWRNSKEPLQTLACCKEIANISRHPNPESYVSYIPIHQDGSCNGLQHYAALGRDSEAARQVNLDDRKLPEDIYSEMALKVDELRQLDARNGIEIAQILEGQITRKVLKQTIMTIVYGVTKRGAFAQIKSQLDGNPNIPEKDIEKAAHYLTKHTFNVLESKFSNTRKIQNWLTDCAYYISTSCNMPVAWNTPLGFAVQQPYHIAKTLTSSMLGACMKTPLSMKTTLDIFSNPHNVKQKNAFPPNFVHSLDSTHMMLTALYCHRAGITFSSVHDCYWTHACDVDTMNKICREQFVNLYKEPILENLSQQFKTKYGFKTQEGDTKSLDNLKNKLNELFSSPPPHGDFDIEKVKSATYFFS